MSDRLVAMKWAMPLLGRSAVCKGMVASVLYVTTWSDDFSIAADAVQLHRAKMNTGCGGPSSGEHYQEARTHPHCLEKGAAGDGDDTGSTPPSSSTRGSTGGSAEDAESFYNKLDDTMRALAENCETFPKCHGEELRNFFNEEKGADDRFREADLEVLRRLVARISNDKDAHAKFVDIMDNKDSFLIWKDLMRIQERKPWFSLLVLEFMLQSVVSPTAIQEDASLTEIIGDARLKAEIGECQVHPSASQKNSNYYATEIRWIVKGAGAARAAAKWAERVYDADEEDWVGVFWSDGKNIEHALASWRHCSEETSERNDGLMRVRHAMTNLTTNIEKRAHEQRIKYITSKADELMGYFNNREMLMHDAEVDSLVTAAKQMRAHRSEMMRIDKDEESTNALAFGLVALRALMTPQDRALLGENSANIADRLSDLYTKYRKQFADEAENYKGNNFFKAVHLFVFRDCLNADPSTRKRAVEEEERDLLAGHEWGRFAGMFASHG